jgi:hypothetical protein
MAYADAFNTRADFIAHDPAPQPLAYEPREVAEFVASTEPQCAAHTAYAAEDAADLEYIARELVSFWRRARARIQSLTYASREADAANLLHCMADQVEDALTPDGAKLFRRYVELYAALPVGG